MEGPVGLRNKVLRFIIWSGSLGLSLGLLCLSKGARKSVLGREVGERGRAEGAGLVGSGKKFDSLQYFSSFAFWLWIEPILGGVPGL